MCTGFWWGHLRESEHWGDQDIDARKWEGVVGARWSLVRIETGGGRL